MPDLLFPGQPSPAVRPPRPPPPFPQPGAGNLRVSLGSNLLLHASCLIYHQVLQLSPTCDSVGAKAVDGRCKLEDEVPTAIVLEIFMSYFVILSFLSETKN